MLIEISQARAIDHRDADAAGFADGFRWRFEDHLGLVESFAGSRDQAERAALEAAVGRGHDEGAVRFRSK